MDNDIEKNEKETIDSDASIEHAEAVEAAQEKPKKFFQRYEQSASYWATIAHVIIFISLFALVGYHYAGLFTETKRDLLPIHRMIYAFSRFAGTYWYIWIPVIAGIIISTYKYRKMLAVRHYAVIITVFWALISIFSYLILSPIWLEGRF